MKMVKILVADDSGFARSMLKKFLHESGFPDTLFAKSGREAVEMFKKHKPDVILMDVSMEEERDGIDALKAVKALSTEVKIIMITALAEELIKDVAVSENADGYLTKPFRKEQVIRALGFVLGYIPG